MNEIAQFHLDQAVSHTTNEILKLIFSSGREIFFERLIEIWLHVTDCPRETIPALMAWMHRAPERVKEMEREFMSEFAEDGFKIDKGQVVFKAAHLYKIDADCIYFCTSCKRCGIQRDQLSNMTEKYFKKEES